MSSTKDEIPSWQELADRIRAIKPRKLARVLSK